VTDKSLLNRRFIRIKAVQNLYAFYIARQANYECAMDQIRNEFVHDVFADPPEDKAQLAQAEQEALQLFTASFDIPALRLADMRHPISRIDTALHQALALYERETAKDLLKLQKGLEAAVDKVNQACARIFQLLLEWAHIAQKQAERPRLSQQTNLRPTVGLHHNRILQRLQANDALIALVKQKSAGWQDNMPLVENWYNQFVKKAPPFLRYLETLASPQQEEQLLIYLVEDIIFNNEVIQEFFNNLDLSWSAHKRLVKKVMREILCSLNQNSEKDTNFDIVRLPGVWEEAEEFYTHLVNKTLERDQALEALITQKTTNWAVERIVLLDKTIMKLAICEMLYFKYIPTKVSINEYVDLAKAYSTPKSSQFVNGLLDAVAATLPEVW
jgi:N utilization substance protein B